MLPGSSLDGPGSPQPPLRASSREVMADGRELGALPPAERGLLWVTRIPAAHPPQTLGVDLLQFNWAQPGSGRFSVCGVEYQFVARIRALTLGFGFPTCKMGLTKPAFLEDCRILREVVRVPCQLSGTDLSLVTTVISSGPLGTTLTPSSPPAGTPLWLCSRPAGPRTPSLLRSHRHIALLSRYRQGWHL